MHKLKFTLLLALLATVWGSSGDQNENFQQCAQLCHIQRCQLSSPHLPLELRLTRWTCDEDCQYRCMHQINQENIRAGRPVEKYYGKWPFWRFAGAQEPASVLFSIINLFVHLKCSARVKKKIPEDHPMKPFIIRWSYVCMNMWIWSTVFHIRDRPTTEKLDYFSAALGIMFALYISAIRIFHLYPGAQSKSHLTLTPRPPSTLSQRILLTVGSLIFIGHVSYLTLLPRFDYTYNIVFGLVLGLIHNFLWLIYSLPSSMSLIHRFPLKPKSYRPHYVNKVAIATFLTTIAAAFEIFDFPPWFGIDAHSLWHLSTAPIVIMWYDFLITDCLDPSWREQKA